MGYNVYVVLQNTAGQFASVYFNGSTVTTGAYTTFLSSSLPVFASNAAVDGLDEHVQALLISMNLPAGTKGYVGYGTSSEEMIQAGRYKLVYQ